MSALVARSPRFPQTDAVLLVFVFVVSASAPTWSISFPRVRRRDALDTKAAAQVFYDHRRGMLDDDSLRLPVPASTTFPTLRFRLPTASIRALRFDPISGPGHSPFAVPSSTFLRRGPSEVCASDLIVLHQIASRAEAEAELTFVTSRVRSIRCSRSRCRAR